MRLAKLVVLPLAAGAVVACSNVNAPANSGKVTLKFTMASSSAALQKTSTGLSLARAAIASLPLEGTNGTLTLDEAWLVVDDVRLKLAADTCAGAGDEQTGESTSLVSLHHGDPGTEGDSSWDGDHCEATGQAPFFVSVPLEGDATGEIGVDVGPGTYDEIELHTGAPDADLLTQIQGQFADWPETASLLVTGSFTPTDSDAVSFRVYFDARIKVEQEFKDNPLEVKDGESITVTVVVDPAKWFTNRDGTVDDLSALDYGTTGEVASFGERSGDGCRIERD